MEEHNVYILDVDYEIDEKDRGGIQRNIIPG